jgi:ParB family chromosome partitioning protein
MELTHLNLDQLSVSKLNMRHGPKAPNVSDLIPLVRARGILVPLLVRPNGSDQTFEIVAGRRRYFAARTLVAEGLPLGALPCAILDDSDDADALEASLIENLARQDADEVSQWVSFVRLVKAGRSVEDIALTFGITEQQVKRVLALGNLLSAIRSMYRKGEIDPATVRHLTLASRARQQEWLTLWRDPEGRAPVGSNLKHWLCGGQSIPTKVAIFQVDTYPGEIISDLFGDDSYFADSELFWEHQARAVEALAAAYREQGWESVQVLPETSYFERWEHVRAEQSEGGGVYITVSRSGEIETHEGWKPRKAERDGQGKGSPAERPELSAPLRNYVDLHRHAVIRAELVKRPDLTLRLIVAHMVCGSGLWKVEADPLQTRKAEIAQSVAEAPSSEQVRRALHDACLLLGEDNGESVIRCGRYGELAATFSTLTVLSDDAIVQLATAAMAESLEAGSELIDVLGAHIALDLSGDWQPDGTFFDLLRNRTVVEAMVEEVAGAAARRANAGTTLKLQKAIIRDCLEGRNGRQKVEGWVPRWLKFPQGSYTPPASAA